MDKRGTAHLLIGPVGAGKTTYARQLLAQSPGVFLDLDVWMVRLFGDDPRPPDNVIAWYLERRERCRGLLWDTAKSILNCGTDVVLEVGLVGAAERLTFYRHVVSEKRRLRITLIDAPREIRRERVNRRNQSPGPFTQVVPPAFFDVASDAWEPPSQEERKTWDIVVLNLDASNAPAP